MSGVAGNSGVCCTCDQYVSDGCGCGGGLPCSLDCQSKTGFAVLCGVDEFTDPSDPPKRYRRVVGSGSRSTKTYLNRTDCSGEADIVADEENHTLYVVDKHTCDATCTPDPEPCGRVNLEATVNKTESETAEVPCHTIATIHSRETTGTHKNSLTDEDTEGDAKERAKTGIDWTDCTSGNSAYVTDRSGTGSFNFAFRDVQVKVLWTAIIGRTYHLRVNFARRFLGSSGPFLDLGMPHESTVVATEMLEHGDWIDVPNDAGWETVPSSCLVTIQPE